MENIKVSRLVKSEDLNHYGTLFAGRMAEMKYTKKLGREPRSYN